MNGRIAHRDGRVYVAVTTARWTEPVLHTVFYPVEAHAGRFDDGAIAHYTRGGYHVENNAPGARLVFVRCAGDTLPDARYETSEEIPAPRTRLKTRWHQGQWEKYSTVKGWVRA